MQTRTRSGDIFRSSLPLPAAFRDGHELEDCRKAEESGFGEFSVRQDPASWRLVTAARRLALKGGSAENPSAAASCSTTALAQEPSDCSQSLWSRCRQAHAITGVVAPLSRTCGKTKPSETNP